MTQNTTRFNVLQNRSLFQLGNTGSKQVSFYMGIICAPKIVSCLQRRMVLPCEVAMVTILSLDSNSVFVTSYSTNTASPTSLLIFTHTPCLFTPPFKVTPAANLKNTISKATPPEIPAWINCSYPRSDGAEVSALSFYSYQGSFSAQEEQGKCLYDYYSLLLLSLALAGMLYHLY